jgi:hypothetical protein
MELAKVRNQVPQTATCHAGHSLNQRCARWLFLARCRIGSDEFPSNLMPVVVRQSTDQVAHLRSASIFGILCGGRRDSLPTLLSCTRIITAVLAANLVANIAIRLADNHALELGVGQLYPIAIWKSGPISIEITEHALSRSAKAPS